MFFLDAGAGAKIALVIIPKKLGAVIPADRQSGENKIIYAECRDIKMIGLAAYWLCGSIALARTAVLPKRA